MCRKNGQQHLSLPVFSRSFFLHPPLTPVAPRLPPPPPPSHQNASRRWLLSSFQRDSRRHHLPHVQTRAGGGLFSFFQPDSHHHHLPRIQTRAGGGLFHSFDPTPTTTSLAFKRELEVVSSTISTACHHTISLTFKRKLEVVFFLSFRPSATTTTSLVSKCRSEVVIFTCFDATQNDWEGHKEGGGARGDDNLLIVIPQSSHQQDPLSFVRGFSSMALMKGWCSYHMLPHSIFFSFYSQQYVFRLYTIKIVTTTPRSTTGFFQRLQRGLEKFYFSKDTQGYPRETWQFEYFQRYPRLPRDHQRDLGNLIISKDT